MPGPKRRRLPPPPPPHKFDPLVLPVHCTESYVQDWAKYGLGLLDAHLRKYADFDQYLQDHPTDDPALD